MKKTILILVFCIQALACLAPGGVQVAYIAEASPIMKVFTLAEKLQAIIDVESANGMNKYNPNETQAVGILQIHPIMVEEVNRILGFEKYQYSDRESEKLSIEMFLVYQNHYNPTMDFQAMARLWVGGARGMQKTSTLNYYNLALTQLYTT
jgi:hypothetical protein